MRAILLIAALALGGCLVPTSAGLGVAPPYRQSLIDPEWDPLPPAATAPRDQPRPDPGRALRRCRRLAGRVLAASAAEAQRHLLRSCVGRASPPPKVNRTRSPRPLDLVLFEQARPTADRPAGQLAGVVVSTAGDRIEFLYARGCRARLGVLNPRAPERRRRRDGTLENTYLRIIQRDDPAGTRYLAGQLLAGFAAPL